MIKRIFPIIGLLTVSFLLPVAGLSCSTPGITAALGQEFNLPVGQTATFNDLDLVFRFIEVQQDSRCPTGVECVTIGEANCLMRITYNGTTSDIVFKQQGGGLVSMGTLNDLNVSYELRPYPEGGKEIVPSDYYLILSVYK